MRFISDKKWIRFGTILILALILVVTGWVYFEIGPWIPFIRLQSGRGTKVDTVCNTIWKNKNQHCVSIINHKEVMAWDISWAYVVDGRREERPNLSEKLVGFADDGGDYEVRAEWLDATHVQLFSNHKPFRIDKLSTDYEVTVKSTEKNIFPHPQ